MIKRSLVRELEYDKTFSFMGVMIKHFLVVGS